MSTVIQPVRPIAPYLGGKRSLAKRICAIIENTEHTTYAEPFVGMGGIFLRRSTRPKAEFINDYGRDVYNLFRVLQEHYVAFVDLIRYQITTQAGFNRLVSVNPETLTDLQRAARFLYLQRLAFGGKVSNQHFGISIDRPSRFNFSTLEPDLEALHDRLSSVTVTCLDFEAFIRRMDRKETLFYVDPPYWGNENDYGEGIFSREDFERLKRALSQLKGRFIFSINDRPEVRTLFNQFEIKPVEVRYSVMKSKSGIPKFGELIISNFVIP